MLVIYGMNILYVKCECGYIIRPKSLLKHLMSSKHVDVDVEEESKFKISCPYCNMTLSPRSVGSHSTCKKHLDNVKAYYASM